MAKLDIIIRNGNIIDGTNSPSFTGNIGIKNGKIIYVTKSEIEEDADVIIDATNLTVTPGFIDVHAHADETLLMYPTADNYIAQGVTTVIGGNCGFSPAPIGDLWLLSFWELDWWHELQPFKYQPPLMHPIEKVNEKLAEKFGFTIKAYILLREEPKVELRRKNERTIKQFPQVAEFYRIFGRYSAVLELLAKNEKELARLVKRIHRLKGVMETETLIVHTTLKNDPKSPFVQLLTSAQK